MAIKDRCPTSRLRSCGYTSRRWSVRQVDASSGHYPGQVNSLRTMNIQSSLTIDDQASSRDSRFCLTLTAWHASNCLRPSLVPVSCRVPYSDKFTDTPRFPGPTPRVKPLGPKRAADSSGTQDSWMLVRPDWCPADRLMFVSGTRYARAIFHGLAEP